LWELTGREKHLINGTRYANVLDPSRTSVRNEGLTKRAIQKCVEALDDLVRTPPSTFPTIIGAGSYSGGKDLHWSSSSER
jgi:hypothetical protein